MQIIVRSSCSSPVECACARLVRYSDRIYVVEHHTGTDVMDRMHYSEGIPCAMHCGYFVLVKILLCRHYPMLKGLYFSGVSQDLAISQTGYITRKCSGKNFTTHNHSVWIRHQRSSQLIILLVMPHYLTAKFSLTSTCEVTRMPPGFTAPSSSPFVVQLRFPYVLVVIIIWLTWCVEPYCR